MADIAAEIETLVEGRPATSEPVECFRVHVRTPAGRFTISVSNDGDTIVSARDKRLVVCPVASNSMQISAVR